LGWDITDFGSGDYYKIGLLMITLRNGNFNDPKYEKPYAEKLLVVGGGQVTPYHYHYKKWEDIINRGGGNLLLRLYNRGDNDTLADTPVTAHIDGHECTVQAGEIVRLLPGESISLVNGLYHTFWGEPGTGTILVGEVSKVNDDRVDNRFLEKIGRFPNIEEDEEPLYLLSMDYFSKGGQ
jgi:D-lyxose ketol-isomerase